MAETIDSLNIEIKSSTDKAIASIDKLIDRLDKIASSIGKVDSGKLTGFANGIDKIAKASMGLSDIRTADFTRLAKNIQQIASINTAGMNSTSSALGMMSKQLSSIAAATGNVSMLGDLAKNISKLGNKSVSNAIANMPQLATAMNELMASLSKAPHVSQNLIQITNALAAFTANSRGISSLGQKPTSALAKLSAAFSQLSGQVTKSTRTMHSFSQMAGRFYANCFLIIRGLKKLGNTITTSFDYVETFNYWNVTMDKVGKEFGGMYEQFGYDSAESYADSFSGRIKSLTQKMTGYEIGSNGELFMTDSVGLGIDPEALMNYQASIAAVTNSVGLIGETSVNAGQALSMLAADMSSLKNVDLTTAMTNFQSGLIGQSRALYKYGIDITNATLQNYAYDLQLSKSVTAMTQAEKMQLRLIAILDQSKVAWGDQANTLGSVANQYRIMQQQITNLARTLGNLFLPIVQKVLPFINGLIIAITRLFSALGFKLHGDNWLKDIMDGTSGGAGGGALEDLEESAGDAEGALDGANAAAKRLKTTTLGIDELNINSPQEESGGSGGSTSVGGDVDLSGAIGDALEEYQSVWDKAFAESENKAQQWADNISGFFKKIADATKPFQDAIKRLWDEGLSKLADFTWTALKDFYNEFLVPMGKWAFGTPKAGLTRLVDIINNSLLAIDWERLNTSLKNFWIAIEPYAEQFGEGLIDFFEDVAGLAVDVINAFPGLMDRLSAALEKGNPESARKWGYALGVLGVGLLALKGIGIVISGLAKFGTAFKGLADGLGALFGGGGVFAGLGNMLAKLGARIMAPFTSIASAIGAPVALIIAAIATVALALIDLWHTSEKFRDAVGTAFALVKDSILNSFDKIKSAFGPMATSFKELGAELYSFYEDSGIKKIVEALASLWAIGVGITASAWIERLSSGIAGVIGYFKGWAKAVGGFLDVIAGVLTLDGDRIVEGFGGIGEGIRGMLGGIAEAAFGWIDDVWTNICDKFREPFENIWSSIADWFIGLWNRITGYVSIAWDAVKDVWNVAVSWFKTTVIDPVANIFVEIGERVGQVFEGLWLIVRTIWEKASQWFYDIVIYPLAEAFTTFSDSVSLIFTQLWQGIVYVWEYASTWFSDIFILPLSEMFGGFKETTYSVFSELWASIQGVWSKACTWFTTNFKNPLVKIFDSIAQSIKDAFDGAWTAIKIGVAAAMNTSIGVVESAINWIIDGINKFIGGFSTVVQWAADILGENWGGINPFEKVKFDRINIDAFAEGGYPNTGQLFMARENGITEMVGAIGNRSAVANNDQIVEGIRQGVYEAVSAAMAEMLGQNQEQPIIVNTTVEMDGRTIVQQTDEARRRMGYNFQPV